MRKVKEEEARLWISKASELRAYVRGNVIPSLVSVVAKLDRLENEMRIMLGDPPLTHPCYHICEEHLPPTSTHYWTDEGERTTIVTVKPSGGHPS